MVFRNGAGRIDLGTARRVPGTQRRAFFLVLRQRRRHRHPVPAPGAQAAPARAPTSRRPGSWPQMAVRASNFCKLPQSSGGERGSRPSRSCWTCSATGVRNGRLLLRRADGRDAGLQAPIQGRTETGPASYEARACLFRGAGAGRLLRSCSRPACARLQLRHHAQLHGQVEPAVLGCSGHIHQSRPNGKANLFDDAGLLRGMSQTVQPGGGQRQRLMESLMFWLIINSYSGWSRASGRWANRPGAWTCSASFG